MTVYLYLTYIYYNLIERDVMHTHKRKRIKLTGNIRTRVILLNLIVIVSIVLVIQVFMQNIVPVTEASPDVYNAASLYKINLSDDEINNLNKTYVDQVNSYGETINIESDALGDSFQTKLYDTTTGLVTSGFTMKSQIDVGINAYDLPVGSYFIQLDDDSFAATKHDLNINFNTITRDGKNSKIEVDSVNGLIHITKYNETENTDELDIIIDAGHGGDDSGALSLDQTISEKDLNLQLATILANDLKELGYNVGLTREDDTNPGTCDDNISSYCSDGRVSKTYQNKAKLVLSVHHNTSGGSGYEVYKSYYASNQLATLVASNLHSVSTPSSKEMGYISDGVYQQVFEDDDNPSIEQDYMYMIRETGGIATNSLSTENEANNTLLQGAEGLLIEFGYLDNAEDLAHISDPEVMNQEASAVADAVDQYLNQSSSSLEDLTSEELQSEV